MALTFIENLEPERMDAYVIHSDQNTLFQCSEWAKVKNNWDAYFTGVEKDGVLAGTALVLARKMPLGKSLFYIPRGPVMDYRDLDLVRFFLDHLVELAKRKHAICLRFDPNILSRKYPYKEKDQKHVYENNDIIETLKKYGAKHKGFTTMIEEATQPRYNAVMNCSDDYYEKLDHKTKQSIHTAERKGAKLYCGHEYIHEFAQAMQYTEKRKGVALRNEEYFRNMAKVYGDRCIIMVAKLNFKEQIAEIERELNEARAQLETCTAKKQINLLNQKIRNDEKDRDILIEECTKEGRDEVILAGKLAIYNENRMEFVYMGNNADYLRIRSSYLLYKTYLDICVEKGIRFVSMGGIEGTLDDGLTKFKSSWLMDVEEYIGEFNIVLDPFVYKLFDDVYPHLLQTAAKLRNRK